MTDTVSTTDSVPTSTTGPTTTSAAQLAGATPTTRPHLLVPGLVSGAVAAIATSAAVLVARAAGEDVAVAGEEIPLVGFAQFVLVGALLGIGLARILSRRARRPRSTFVRTTVALTAASIVPDLVVDATTGAKLVLVLTHVVAAAIIVPVLASRLPEHA